MKRLTAILFAVGLALMARAETRLGDVVMKDVVVLEPVDKTNLLDTVNALTNGAALGATALQPSWAATGHVATAGAADFATTADTATTADYATDAGSADYATTTTTADNANFADFATTATEAVSAQSLTPDMADAIALAAATAHTNSPAAHPDIRQAIDGLTAAPEWIGITNLAASVTVTNSYERPVYLYATGTVSVAFSGLRTPMPLYLVLRGPDSLTFPGAYYIGGGSWQTNMSNHFVVWKYGTNLFVNPVTSSED